ncbi:hypothetical protein TRICI_004547 [Trichomonascus ciferrii]|uniref:BHLH domain-containing protein n=1 Tax=Trichomonascus ciferrii TaxID=44093 RepID=A0A642V5K4_9ASCO|nr:hypothetical protein TRICI_004547 [Trichomonascus ciferrii]
MSTPHIKQEPVDDDDYGAGGLLSRSYLTRGGMDSHFDDVSSSMIDESDLLDLEGLSPPAHQNPHLRTHPPNPPGGAHMYASPQQQQQHALAAASIGFASGGTPTTGGGRPPLVGSYGATPPVPESTSPFDDFMLQQQARGGGGPQTHTQRFLQQDSYSNASTPYGGSYASPPSSASGNKFLKPTSVGGEGPGGGDNNKQAQLLAERRRRRRESHNAVERRRRDNINEKIKELCDLLPEAFLYAANDPTAYNGSKDDKPNKGTILARSVDYIRKLQQIIDDQNRRELELQDSVQQLQRQCGQPVTDFGETSAEAGLARLGLDEHPPHSPEFTPDLDYYKHANPLGYHDALNSSAIADDDDL